MAASLARCLDAAHVFDERRPAETGDGPLRDDLAVHHDHGPVAHRQDLVQPRLEPGLVARVARPVEALPAERVGQVLLGDSRKIGAEEDFISWHTHPNA